MVINDLSYKIFDEHANYARENEIVQPREDSP